MLRSICLAATLLSAAPALADPFSFVALGDMPYGAPDKVWPRYETLIGRINDAAPALVVHVGDTKSGSTACDDKMLDQQLVYMNSFAAPTLYTPGDNEWTDCHRKKAGGFDPLERLAHIRATYFDVPETSFGQAQVSVTSQAKKGYPENARLMHEGVMFVTAHVVGSNNNFEIRDLDAVAEFFARDKATTNWLDQSFDAAKDAAALVLAIHADMFEFDFNPDKESWLRHSGFLNFGPMLQAKAAEFGKPVLLIFGDSHVHRVFRPFPKTAPNVTALEVFGAEDMHAVEVTVDPARPAPFGFRPLLNAD
ncbi:MAG: hypothetical protein ACJAWZ_003065 [Paracoccaceae bacterium]|jgi:hypothetical protein